MRAYLFVLQRQNLGRRFGASKMHLNPTVAWPAVRSKTVVLLLLIHCFMYLPLFVGFCVWSLFRYAILSILSSFLRSSRRGRESWLLCFNCIFDAVLLIVLCGFLHGAVCWSEVSDCGIS